MIVERVEDDEEGREVHHCGKMTWRGHDGITPDGYRASVGIVFDPPAVVIRIEPPWHKPFHISVMGDGNAIDEAERAIAAHRRRVGPIPNVTSHGNVFLV